MIRASVGLLGLCAVVLVVMALSAGAGQAESGAKWLILETVNGTVVDGSILHATLKAEAENNSISLLTKILGIEVEIKCTSLLFIAVNLEGNGGLNEGGGVRLNGCQVKLKGVLSEECKVRSPLTAPVGLVLSNLLTGLLVLAGGQPRLVLEPAKGETAIVTLYMGEECVIGEQVTIRGKLSLKDGENALSTHKAVHLFEEDSVNTHLWVLILNPEHKMTVDGGINMFLSGEHSGMHWSGDAA